MVLPIIMPVAVELDATAAAQPNVLNYIAANFVADRADCIVVFDFAHVLRIFEHFHNFFVVHIYTPWVYALVFSINDYFL